MDKEINGYPQSELNDILSSIGDPSVFYGKTILILGGSGFLGSAFKAFFIYLNQWMSGACLPMGTKRCNIISVDNYVGRDKPKEIEAPNLIHIEHDLVESIEDKLPFGKLDFLINCSGNASPSNYSIKSLETIDISTIAVRNLLRLARAHQAKILNFSSSEVLGTPPDDKVPTDETYTPSVNTTNPRSCYDVGKMMLEVLSWEYKTKLNTDVKVVRLFNCVGRFRQNDFRVLPNFLSAALKNEPLKVFGDGSQTRTFSYYTDVIAGCIKVLLHGEDLIYHIGSSDNEISMLDFAKMVEKVANKKDLVQLVPSPKTYEYEPRRRCPSIEKAKKLGYSPKISVEEMVRRVYNWAKVNYDY